MRRREATPQSLPEDEGEEGDASDHVRHVDAGHHVEQRAEDPILQPEAQLRIVVQLQAQEDHAEPDRGAEPPQGLPPPPVTGGPQRELDGDAARH